MIFGVFEFFQKTNEQILLTTMTTCFHSSFGRNRRHQKSFWNYLTFSMNVWASHENIRPWIQESNFKTSKLLSPHHTAIATKISTSYKNNMTLFGVKTLIIPLKKKSLLETAKSMAEKNASVYSSMGPGVDIFFPLLCMFDQKKYTIA